MKMFQEKFIRLCDIKRVHPTVACTSVGLSSSAFSEWIENTVPCQATLAQIADYFGVSVGYLLGTDDEKTPPAKAESVQYTDMELLEAFRSADERTRDAIRMLLGIKEGK
jgi:transcriptional regulator with XRE-family HTH domain